MFALHLLRVIERTNRQDVKVFVSYPVGVSSSFRCFGPTSVGGQDNLRPLIEAYAKEIGRDITEVAFEVTDHVSGRMTPAHVEQFFVVSPQDTYGTVPGLHTMYDYEYVPQAVSRPIESLLLAPSSSPI